MVRVLVKLISLLLSEPGGASKGRPPGEFSKTPIFFPQDLYRWSAILMSLWSILIFFFLQIFIISITSVYTSMKLFTNLFFISSYLRMRLEERLAMLVKSNSLETYIDPRYNFSPIKLRICAIYLLSVKKIILVFISSRNFNRFSIKLSNESSFANMTLFSYRFYWYLEIQSVQSEIN